MSDDMREYTVSTQSDYLEKVSQARPISAISEIIWNGLDADAYNINVDIRKDISDDINRLKCLKKEEVLTQEEYDEQRKLLIETNI